VQKLKGGEMKKLSIEAQKSDWLKWLHSYGAAKFLDRFLANVEGAASTCVYCGQTIYIDVLIGGGVADWSTEEGDFGCDRSPEASNEGCGSHMPVKRCAKEGV
jgi:hypothetical protein